MGKQGPCHHCGVTCTPLWRNGPPDKPILCNACGSRWRTKGTLTNYTPLHARLVPLNVEDCEISEVRSIFVQTKGQKMPKRKKYNHNPGVEKEKSEYSHYNNILKDAKSNRSNSSAESCVQHGNYGEFNFTGSMQSNVWDTLIPSRKRTCLKHPKASPMEQLTKDLYCILNEQRTTYLSEPLEEDLLYQSNNSMVSTEIGHGGVLIRHSDVETQEDESEASFVPKDVNIYTVDEAYSGIPGVKAKNESNPLININIQSEGRQENIVRGKSCPDGFHQILHDVSSPLISVDLKDIANFEEYQKILSNEEQKS